MAHKERFAPSIDVHDLPLVEVALQYETEGLLQRFQDVLEQVGLAGNELIQRSKELCLTLHKDDERTYEPFVNHPLRVAIRLVEELGLTDPNIIAAALLHDTVEDHPDELVEQFHPEEVPDDPHLLRTYALEALQRRTNSEVATIVEWMSNPILHEGEDSYQVYAEHMKYLTTEAPPEVRALKYIDFEDNFRPPDDVEDPEKRRRLDTKQIGMYILHTRGLWLPDSIVTGERRQEASMILLEGYLMARSRMEEVAREDSDTSSENSLRIA